MKYKISYYDQSLSKLYVRCLEKDEDGYFNCFLFWGTKRILMPCMIEFDDTIYVHSEDTKKDNGPKKFYFSHDMENCVMATSVQIGKAKDFPEVDRIELVNLLNYNAKIIT